MDLDHERERIARIAFFASLGQTPTEELTTLISYPASPFLYNMQLPDVREAFIEPVLPEWMKLQQKVRWQTIIRLYEAGHWPIGYSKDTLVWI